MRALIAEDDAASGKFLKKLLEHHGDVVLCTNGLDAVNAFVEGIQNGQKFDLVCLDIMMPKIDGYKALQAIRDAERKLGTPRISRVKVVMVSALDEEFDASYAVDDYDDYLCKPIDVMKFENIIRKLDLI